MIYFIYLLVFLFGSAIGSFLNVVIFRLYSGQVCRLGANERIVGGRSHCPKCGQILAWYDLIPIVSFLALQGRCRACQKPISWQYPAVELATGALFAAIVRSAVLSDSEGSWVAVTGFFASFGMTNYIHIFYHLFIVCSLIIIFVYDLRHYIIPDRILFPAIGAALLFKILNSEFFSNFEFRISNFQILIDSLLAAGVAAIFFLLLILITRGRGMGMGDVKLVFLMGLVLGWPEILFALFLAFFSGAAVGLGLITASRKTLKSKIPFGPFLAGATVLVMLVGPYLFCWSQNFLYF